MSTLLDSVGNFLVWQGLVNGSSGWKLYKGNLPEEPDKAVAVYETQGETPETTMDVDYPGFQVRVRTGEVAGDYALGSEQATAIYRALHGGPMYDEQVSPPKLFVYCYAQSQPVAIGRDKNGRQNFVINFRTMRTW